MYLIFPVVILSSLMAYVCLRLKATKSTALTSTVSFNILVLVFVEADFFRFFRNFLSWKNVSLTLVGLIVLEIYLRVESRHSPRRKLIDFEYVKNFGPDFAKEYDAYYKSLRLGVDFNSYCLKNKIELHQININNESRFTVGQPQEPSSRIFILGGSTVFNAQVPNSDTIASLLQSKLSENSSKYSVINFGKSGATSVDRINFIENQQTLSKGDVVILYFGINDACLIKPNFKYKSNPIHLVLVAYNMGRNFASKCLWSFEKLPRISKFGTKYAVKKYLKMEVSVAIKSFNIRCESLGVRFLAVLQPSAYSCKGLTRSDRHYLNTFINSPEKALKVASKVILKELGSDRYFVNGGGVFDCADEAVFTDWCHTTKHGNSLLSDFFFVKLAELDSFEVRE